LAILPTAVRDAAVAVCWPIQARLGHATAAETLDTTYSHLWPDSDSALCPLRLISG
jgi:hypothetical protein